MRTWWNLIQDKKRAAMGFKMLVSAKAGLKTSRSEKSRQRDCEKKNESFVLSLRWDFLRTHIFRHHCGRLVNTRLSWLWGTVHAAPLPVNNNNNNNNKLYLGHFSVFEVNYHMSIVPSLFLKSSGLKMFSVQVKAVFLWFDKRFWNALFSRRIQLLGMDYI